MMRRCLSRIAFATIALLLVPTPAWSQYNTATVLRPRADAERPARLPSIERLERSGSESRVGHDAKVGAAIGAGVGLITAIVLTTQPNVHDHSEDIYGYVLGIGLGTILGYGVGAVVGVIRR